MSQEGLNVSSAFPPPPMFFKHFTQENLAALKAHQKLGTPNDQLPEELQYLVPPPPPTTSYRCFGDTWKIPDVLPSLPELGITQLYPSTTEDNSVDRAKELMRLSKSLLMNFLELVAVLGVNPAECGPKIQDLRTILINMHHLINEYRPHQARETLILMMEEQLEKSRKETEENKKASKTIQAILDAIPAIVGNSALLPGEGVTGQAMASAKEGSSVGSGEVGESKEDGEKKKDDLELWNALDEMSLLQSQP